MTITTIELNDVLAAHPEVVEAGWITASYAASEAKWGRTVNTDPPVLREVQAAVEFLRPAAHCKATKAAPTSYALKHLAERSPSGQRLAGGYISNGALIAAALLLGIDITKDHLNPFVGVTRRSIRAIIGQTPDES